MFEQSLIDERSSRIGAGSLAVSFAAQCIAILGVLAAPIVHTYELPLADWAQSAVFFTPPPPPPPPPPPRKLADRLRPPPPGRFERRLTQPTVIPDRIALDDGLGLASLAQLAGTDASGLAAGSPGGIHGGVLGGLLTASAALPPPPRPVRIGGRVQSARLIERVSPTYPQEAIEEQISGSVRLEAVIARDGSIKRLRVLSGDPLLAAAAREAVEQWRYRPTRLNGTPVEVITSIEVTFKLELILVDEKGRPVKEK